jgi:hypothetical protein
MADFYDRRAVCITVIPSYERTDYSIDERIKTKLEHTVASLGPYCQVSKFQWLVATDESCKAIVQDLSHEGVENVFVFAALIDKDWQFNCKLQSETDAMEFDGIAAFLQNHLSMPSEASVIDIDAEVEKFFDASSRTDGKPRLVLISGGACSGKTTLRREKYTEGFVVLDAAEIFLNLSQDEYYDFPDAFLEPMELIGQLVAQRALQERRNLVTETLGIEVDLEAIAHAIGDIDYHLESIWVDCDPKVGWERNVNRSSDNISAYYTQAFHQRWLLEAAKELSS